MIMFGSIFNNLTNSAKAAKGITQSVFNMTRAAASNINRTARAAGQSISSSKTLWGLSAFSESWKTKLALPSIMLGMAGAYQVGENILGAGYSLDSPLATRSSIRGLSQPINTTMGFSRMNWNAMQDSANGSLAFALHNVRKG